MDENSTNFMLTTTEDNMVNFDDEWQRILVAVIMLIASIAGTFGNSLIILSVLLSRKLRSPTNVFVVNLSAADLLTCLALPWNIVALLSFDDGWPLADWVCSGAAAILYIPVYCSVCTLASIGVNRLIMITRPVHIYRKIFSTKVLCAWIILLWLWPFLITVLPPLVGFGALGYNERFHSCSSMTSNEYSDEYDLMTAIAIYPIPLFTILISYIGIFVHVRKQANKLNNNPNSPTGQSMTEDSVTLSPQHGPQSPKYPIPLTSAPKNNPESANGNVQNGDEDEQTKDGDQLPPMRPVSKATARVLEESNYKTNSLPSNRTYNRSPSSGVTRTSSFPIKISSTKNGTASPLRRKPGQSITQRIRSTIKEATTFKRISRRQLAITKNMFYVVIAYILCLTPFVFCLVIDTPTSTAIIPYAAALIFFNSCINPAIYATKHPHFKQIFSYLVKCQWHRIPEPSDTLRALMNKGLCNPK
ncbi:uncharacterized protein [Amphiura filiformis]|uniref:uncharacterized protein n=1 Tax=Amphiura filiformis TaxID=82378 RepID=UPI003B21A3F9